jgi:predicted acylesterase/phospholipase RssA
MLATRSDSGIVFSGGGVRAYSCTLGQLRALHDLGVLDKTRHVTGISGGSWATSVFM